MLTRQKIALISSSWPPYGQGGITAAHFNLAQILKRNNCQVKAFTFGDEITLDTDEVFRSGPNKKIIRFLSLILAVLFRIKGSHGLQYQLLDFLSSYAAFKFNRQLKKYSPDVVIFPDHGIPAFFVKKNPKTIFMLISHHNPARFLNNPHIEKHSELDTKWTLYFENLALNKIDHVICPSEYMKSCFEETYSYIGPVSVIPNIVNVNTIRTLTIRDVRAELNLENDSIIIYIPSAGSPFKGVDYVFDIVSKISASNSRQVGFFLSGEMPFKLKNQLINISPSVALFAPGKLPYEDNIAYMKSCSLCVSPCLIESFGMALLEAVSCGVPVVSFDTGGNRMIVENGISGYLVPVTDVDCLIEKSLDIIKQNHIGQLRSSSLDFFERRFKPELLARRFTEIFDSY